MQDDEFPWGKADGAHSWHEGDNGMSIKFNPLSWGSLKSRLRKHEQNSVCVCDLLYKLDNIYLLGKFDELEGYTYMHTIMNERFLLWVSNGAANFFMLLSLYGNLNIV
jgi:hypothetical protein